MIKDEINTAMVKAMKAQRKDELSTIRLINAKIKDKEIADRTTTGKELDDNGVLIVLQQMVKQRQDSVHEYTKAQRLDLANKESAEIEIIRTFMPKQLSLDEINQAITKAIAEVQATSLKDLGKVVTLIKNKYTAQVDMGVVTPLIKKALDV